MRIGRVVDAMKPDFRGVGTHWNQGFMTFRKPRRIRYQTSGPVGVACRPGQRSGFARTWGMPLVVSAWSVIGNAGAAEGATGHDKGERDPLVLGILAVADTKLHSPRDPRAVDYDRAGPLP